MIGIGQLRALNRPEQIAITEHARRRLVMTKMVTTTILWEPDFKTRKER